MYRPIGIILVVNNYNKNDKTQEIAAFEIRKLFIYINDSENPLLTDQMCIKDTFAFWFFLKIWKSEKNIYYITFSISKYALEGFKKNSWIPERYFTGIGKFILQVLII